MRKIKIGFKAASLLVGVTALGATAITACSSDPTIIEYGDEPDTGVGDDSGPDVMDAQPDRAKRDASDGGNDAKSDADAMADADARLDADAKKDADADADLAETGTACAPKNSIQTRKCGFCGFQERACLDPEDSGTPLWLDWGPCLHEVTDGCNPGDTRDGGCGKCGHMTQTCTNACKWPDAGGKCLDEGVCNPGDTRYKWALSCDIGGRYQDCSDECEWGAPTPDCVFEDMPELLVPETVGGKNTIQFAFTSTMPTHLRLNTGSCPTSISGTTVSYQYVRIRNTTGHDARVSIWDSVPDGGSSSDTIMAVYDTGAMPKDSDTAARTACMTGTSVFDTCSGTSDPTMCKGQQSGFTDVGGALPGNTLVAPANSILIIYDAPWTSSNYRTYNLSILTHSFSP